MSYNIGDEEIPFDETPLKIVCEAAGELGFWINPVTFEKVGCLSSYTEDVGFDIEKSKNCVKFCFNFIYWPLDGDVVIQGWLKTRVEKPRRDFRQLKYKKSFDMALPENIIKPIMKEEMRQVMVNNDFIPTWVYIWDVPGI